MQTRQVSGVVIYVVGAAAGLEIMLVQKPGKDWVHPKGGVEVDMSERDSAAKEAWEEAGVKGLVGMELGTVDFLKGNVVQNVRMYAMRAVEIADTFPESELRERRWFKYVDALKVVDRYNAVFIARLHLALQQSGVLK